MKSSDRFARRALFFVGVLLIAGANAAETSQKKTSPKPSPSSTSNSTSTTPTSSSSTSAPSSSWVRWARRVGRNEPNYEQAVKNLQKTKNLENLLLKALKTPNRPLAFDVIAGLQLKKMVPELLTHVRKDTDGFLTLTVNSLLDEKNKDQILNSYVEHLQPAKIKTLSPAAIIALLEPLGRLGVVLVKPTLTALSTHKFPEVRAGVLSYIRVMTIKHNYHGHDEWINQALSAGEFQVRLQAISFLSEVATQPEITLPLSMRRPELLMRCQKERHPKVREHCLSLLSKKPMVTVDSFNVDLDPEVFYKNNRDVTIETTIETTEEKDESRVPSATAKTSAPASKTGPAPTCQVAYRQLFSRPIVNIRMIFGYKDTRPSRFVGDHHERLAFIQRIIHACPSQSSMQKRDSRKNQSETPACGFSRSSVNADLFIKSIDGPDKKKVKIQLWIANSSVDSDDEANRANPFQAWHSAYARGAFFTGLRDADVLFYNGHSRFGGGPDFEPPHLTPLEVVDEDFYKSQRPGFTKAIDVLRTQAFTLTSHSQMKVLGLFSCASVQHFSDDIKKFTTAGLISSRNLIYYADALENSYAALSALLSMRCRKDFDTALRNNKPPRGMFLQGFLPAAI